MIIMTTTMIIMIVIKIIMTKIITDGYNNNDDDNNDMYRVIIGFGVAASSVSSRHVLLSLRPSTSPTSVRSTCSSSSPT